MNEHRRPSALASTLTLLACVVAWGVVKLVIFRETSAPLTYVLPLLVCVWTRRRWHLVTLAAIFIGMASVKYFVLLPADLRAGSTAFWGYFFSVFNILAGLVVIEVILRLRDALDARAEAIQRQNLELEAQAEELAQQNEEIRTQSEELAQQNEEIETQSEELQRQNEELVEVNQRLVGREQVLQAAVTGARRSDGRALEEVCRAVLSVMGSPAELLVVAEIDGPDLRVLAQVVIGAEIGLPERWPAKGSLAGIVIEQQRTAYIDDLDCRPDLSRPFGGSGGFRSSLATPFMVGGQVAGVVKAASRTPGHWTQEQFRLLEWTAAQCGWIVEGLRWQGALRERADAIEAANRAKDDFLATLSHELRTPLSPVLVAVEQLIEDGRLADDVREQLQMVRRNVSVQSRLIDDLLDLTRIARGKMDLNQQPVSVHTLLRETAAIVAGDLALKKQTLELDLELPADCHVNGDAARLQQVFWNLLKNSTKFSPEGATIHLRASLVPGDQAPAGAATDDPRNRRVVVQVVDSGTGIAPDDLKRIFLPFEQVAARRKRDGTAGLGLGLSIARAITELHDGSIHVASEGLGAGATFTVMLPLAGTESIAVATLQTNQVRTDSPTRSGAGPRILLVEDHTDTGEAMVRLLRRSGFEVEYVTSIAAAVASWSQGEYQILISDLGLPDGSGIDLIRQLRALSPAEIPAICMSGYGMESDLEHSRQAGFREHLIKPIAKQQLLDAIRRVLESPRHGAGLEPGFR